MDISSSRRRGRPKRSQESAQQLQFNCAENESAVQSQHADQHAKRDVDLPEETSTFTGKLSHQRLLPSRSDVCAFHLPEQGPDYRYGVLVLVIRMKEVVN